MHWLSSFIHPSYSSIQTGREKRARAYDDNPVWLSPHVYVLMERKQEIGKRRSSVVYVYTWWSMKQKSKGKKEKKGFCYHPSFDGSPYTFFLSFLSFVSSYSLLFLSISFSILDTCQVWCWLNRIRWLIKRVCSYLLRRELVDDSNPLLEEASHLPPSNPVNQKSIHLSTYVCHLCVYLSPLFMYVCIHSNINQSIDL